MVRPTKLPSVEHEFGLNGNFYASVRQTRFGVRGYTPTSIGDLLARFEFDLVGVGPQAGQTAFRLRYAYGQLGEFAIGQMESVFMDVDVLPNSIESWGPNGVVFFRNIQVRWMPIRGSTHLTVALERPGASGDAGSATDRVDLSNIHPRFPAPDLTAQYRRGEKWGYVQVSGILRYMAWDDLSTTTNLSGSAVGWGLSVSSNITLGKNDVVKGEVVYGEGVENYMNDAPVDVGAKNNPGNALTPFLGVALPVFGLTAFLDHTWNDKLTSSIGYSQLHISNSDAQLADAFRLGQYAIANVLYTPHKNFLVGVEAQWGQRQNNSDGFTSNDFRLQFTGKYSYGLTIGGGKQ